MQLKLSDGTDYEGEVRDGSPNGVGVCKFPNGDRYEGFWEAGQPHGHGTLFYQAEPFKGDRHEGNFSSGVPNGHGVYFFSNGSASGDVFEGMYAAGVPNGLGEYRYANGDRFEGTYVDGKRHGEGIASFKEAGHTFEGWFDQGKQTGCASSRANPESYPPTRTHTLYAIADGGYAYGSAQLWLLLLHARARRGSSGPQGRAEVRRACRLGASPRRP